MCDHITWVQMTLTGQARGHFVMPYTNPTWWDPLSPTMQSLPSKVSVLSLCMCE